MKVRILFILVFVLTFLLCFKNVSANELCSQIGYSVFTVNGINTDEVGAIKNKDNLKKNLPPTYNNEPLFLDYLYNPTHLAGAGDLIDYVKQGFFDQKSDYDLIEMLNDSSQKVTTQKLLLVAHSQGNFYANNFYDKVASQEGGVPSKSIGVYSVATPASRVAGDGKYVTSDTDGIIASLVGGTLKRNILTPNTHIVLKNGDDTNGHDFSGVYLKHQGDKIVSDIKSSLDKLKANDEQDSGSPCISAPKLTLFHKAQGLAFAVADPTAVVVKGGAIAVYNAGAYVRDGASNVGMAIGNFLHNTTLAIAGKVNGLMANALSSIGDASSLTTDLSSLSDPVNDTSSQKTPVTPAVPQIAENNPVTVRLDEVDSSDNQNNNNQAVAAATQDSPVLPPTVTAEEDATLKTESTATVDTTSHNLYKDLLPGGGGVSAGSTFNPPPVVPPVLEEVPPAPDPVPPAPKDTTPPVISLNGASPVSIDVGSIYTDPGATALDDVDGVVDAVASGTIDTSVAGTYTITYTAKDAANNTTSSARIINVIALPLPEPVIPPDTTAPNTPVITTAPGLVNTNSVYIAGTAEDGATIIVSGGSGTATGVATGGNFSIDVPLNQNTTNTLSVTATDAAGNTSAPATISFTHDNIPPVINYLHPYTSPAQTIVVGGTFYVTISADAADYTAGAVTVNNVPVNTFTDNRSGIYTITHIVKLGEADQNAGMVPVSVVLTDAAGNSNTAYTSVSGNSIAINGHAPASVAQAFPIFNSLNGKFTENAVLNCVSDSGFFQMYYVPDSNSIFHNMNISGGTVLCPSGHQTFVSRGLGFSDYAGYAPTTGWYYGIVSIGNPKCDATNTGRICVNNNIQSFFRLHRNATGIWSDTDVADVTPPLIASYTLNGTSGDITISPTKASPLALVLNANENVNWMSIKIENQNDASIYKIFQSGTGCADGTNTCAKSWDGTLSTGGLLQSGSKYKIRVHVQDMTGNNYEDYLPSNITIN